MTTQQTPLPAHLAEPTRIGDEISITGKWVSKKPGGFFRSSDESQAMLEEWQDIHTSAREDEGVLSTEINHAVGQDAVLVHHVFRGPEALGDTPWRHAYGRNPAQILFKYLLPGDITR